MGSIGTASIGSIAEIPAIGRNRPVHVAGTRPVELHRDACSACIRTIRISHRCLVGGRLNIGAGGVAVGCAVIVGHRQDDAVGPRRC
ncbi:MAG: hypothetical protein P8Y14_27990, partial [Anaerolineales bacterium]